MKQSSVLSHSKVKKKSKVRPFLLLLTFINCAQFGQRPKEQTHHGAFKLRFTVWVCSERRYGWWVGGISSSSVLRK